MANGAFRRVGSVTTLVRARRWQPLRAIVARGAAPAGLFRWARLAICRLDAPPPVESERLRLRFAGRRDLDALCAIRDRRSTFERYLDAGARPVLGTLGGEPASISWIEPGRIHVSRSNGYSFDIGPGAVWAFGCEVAPELRRQGLYREHWSQLMRLLEPSGVRRAYLAIMLDDARSLAAHRAIGFLPEWELTILRCLGLTAHRARSLGPDGPRDSRLGFGSWRGRSLPRPAP